MIERKGIIVYFNEEKTLNRLDKSLVNVYYVSKNNKYAIIYFDAKKYKNVVEMIGKIQDFYKFEDVANNIGDFTFEQ